MRAQITGLERATNNAQDGISLVQTAEGALTEVHSMLNRMVDLATQASNGTYDNDVDRLNLEKEVTALKEEIDRVATSTNFNGIKLLNGSLGGAATTTPATIANGKGTTFTAAEAATQGEYEIALSTTTTHNSLAIGYTDDGGSEQTVILSGVAITGTAADDIEAIVNAVNSDATLSELFEATKDATNKLVLKAKTAGAGKEVVTKFEFGTNLTDFTSATTVNAKSGTAEDAKLAAVASFGTDGNAFKIGDITYEYDTDKSVSEGNVAITSLEELTKEVAKQGYTVGGSLNALTFTPATAAGTGNGLRLQIGDTADQTVSVAVGDMSSTALGLGGVSVASETSAADSIQLIKDAINTVSGTRADLGAIQNRLEHTVNNLTTTTENMTNAESRIRDTDMAKEMMAFTKNNVLAQAAQSMLAQANQQPQQVLQLLR